MHFTQLAQPVLSMLPHSTPCTSLSLQLLSRLNYLKKPLLLLPLFIFMLTISGCGLAPSWFNPGLSPTSLNLSLQQVKATGKPGIYTITGDTSLPEGTKITVSAVRYLNGGAELVDSTTDVPYAILDRQLATVSQGTWQATLNIWQTASDGLYQEPWQLSQTDAGVIFEPDPNVIFMATFDPVNQPVGFKAEVEEQDEALQAILARFTTDGELYLQATKTLSVALPTGKTSAPAKSRSEDAVRQSKRANPSNSSRSQVSNSPRSQSNDQQPTTWSTTNAPLSSGEFMR